MSTPQPVERSRLLLFGLWIALMFTYVVGDVLRVFAGDFEPGEIAGISVGDSMFLVAAIIMLIPIAMIVLSLVLPRNLCRWSSIVVSILFLAFNAVGLPGYPSFFDQFLVIVGLLINLIILWVSWSWPPPDSDLS